MIKKDKDTQGIRIEGKEGKKIFQYADDTTLILRDLESVKEVMGKVKSSGKGTGAKVNEEKTVYRRFGGVLSLFGGFNLKRYMKQKNWV